MSNEENWWDDEQVAEYLGISVKSVPMWLHRKGIKRYMVADERVGVKPRMLVRKSQVIKGKRVSPGQGHRTDLTPVAEPAPTLTEYEAKKLKEEELWKASRSTRI